MPDDIAPDAQFELKLVFLKELDAEYRKARAAHDHLTRNVDDAESLKELRGFFHRIAGTAHAVDYPVLGHLAAVCEGVADLVLERKLEASVRTLQLFADGLAAVTTVLDMHAQTSSPRPPRPAADATGLLQPGPAGTDRTLSKILVVDDDVFSAGLIDGCLRSAGFMSSFTCDPIAAMTMIQEELPDLIIVDVVMPGLDGFELCRRVREHPALQFTPVIFVTRRGDVEQRIKGLSVGGNDYIAKPFEPQELVARVRAHLQRLAEMRDMATRDGLTRCYNHKYFKSRLEQELARAKRYKLELALGMLDVDRFKAINDSHGHQAGDAVLTHLSNLIMASVRSTDVVARYGGEEFGIIFVQAAISEAEIIARRIRERIASHRFAVTVPDSGLLQFPVTVSIGVAPLSAEDDVKSIIYRADSALYDAKNAGRDRVNIAMPAEAETTAS
jgi:diguanylate cyclase (GGDEF)-like protein